MILQAASRKKAKIKMGLQGPSGSGKTMSALLVAFGITGDWTKIAIVDTENNSADLYAHLGSFNTVSIHPPFTPERYREALFLCLQAKMEVVIIDSISHEWDGIGGILDIHSAMPGNSFTNWSKVTPRHNAFIQELLQSPAHIIATVRSKQDYVLVEKDGKQVPEKVGLKGITKEGLDYEFTLMFELNLKHFATAGKDRTNLFMDQPDIKLNEEVGKRLLEWCNQGEVDMPQKIRSCNSVEELIALYKQSPEYQNLYAQHFTQRKAELQSKPLPNPLKPQFHNYADRALDFKQ